jgi:RNAse (barnase) inhibitor barstar
MKKVYEIDGEHFSTLEGFYEEISDKLLTLGIFWGKNLDAFDDVLYGGFGTPDEGFMLVWKNSNVSMEKLGYSETIRQLALRLEECHPSNRGRVQEDLQKAQRNAGHTVFDWLVDIIQSHKNIELRLQ